MSEMSLEYAHGYLAGGEAERNRTINLLKQYLELTRFSESVEGTKRNPKWTQGFSAALAIIEGQSK
jgi:hypothetical protein